MNATATTTKAAKRRSYFFVIVNETIVDVAYSREEASRIANDIDRDSGESVSTVARGRAMAATECKQPLSYVNYMIEH